MSVIGSISIKDNVTATLRIIKKEQTSFREDVKKTREEMEKTWKEKYQAKLDANAQAKKIVDKTIHLYPEGEYLFMRNGKPLFADSFNRYLKIRFVHH